MLINWKITPRKSRLSEGRIELALIMPSVSDLCKDNEQLAQGIAQGNQWVHTVRPENRDLARAKQACLNLAERKRFMQRAKAFGPTGRKLLAYNIPRALPWAMSLLALQAVSTVLTKL